MPYIPMEGLTPNEIDRMFLQYIEYALIEFELPHQKNETERLEVYRNSFHKVITEFFIKRQIEESKK